MCAPALSLPWIDHPESDKARVRPTDSAKATSVKKADATEAGADITTADHFARRVVITGAAAGLAGAALFIVIHSLLIFPIWTRFLGHLPFALLAGLGLAEAFDQAACAGRWRSFSGGARFGLVMFATLAPASWVTVVGIAPSIRQRNVQEPTPDPVVYVPLRAQTPVFAMLLIRAQRDAATLTSLVREEVRAIDQDLPLFGILTMDQQLALQRWPFRVFGSMFAIFAVIALALSAVGLYAVTAYSVAQRTQEIGVRMALGAQAAQVWWLVLRRAIAQMVIGLAIGMAGAPGDAAGPCARLAT